MKQLFGCFLPGCRAHFGTASRAFDARGMAGHLRARQHLGLQEPNMRPLDVEEAQRARAAAETAAMEKAARQAEAALRREQAAGAAQPCAWGRRGRRRTRAPRAAAH